MRAKHKLKYCLRKICFLDGEDNVIDEYFIYFLDPGSKISVMTFAKSSLYLGMPFE